MIDFVSLPKGKKTQTMTDEAKNNSETENEKDNLLLDDEVQGEESSTSSNYKIPSLKDENQKHHLSGMYQTWFLDYASAVNLDRAIPHINDGLKPVQRRVLHAMRCKENGSYHKVANIVGDTMHYHPHSDASIYDALVHLGQKELLIDCQGSWGNILTGDGAAAARYIEARLSKFAIEVVFNPKITSWKYSYDGTDQEPIYLPVKFPLLLAQGSEGIGLGLNSKILPHNFNELIDASIAYLKNKPFELLPDFPTGGYADVRNYNDGGRGGKVRIRAKIEKLDNKTLVIKEIPFGTTTENLMESVIKANEKGKINIKHIDDNTSSSVEILIHLDNKTSSDKTIDALYAFTQCEMSYSPVCCVVDNNKPCFITVSEVLRRNTDQTVNLLTQELQIQLSELEDHWHWVSLEKVFFEKRIYKVLEEDFESWEEQVTDIERKFDPYRKLFRKEITREDVLKLCEKPVRKISKFDIKKADEDIADTEASIIDVKNKLEHIIDYTIDWFKKIKTNYGKNHPRLTEIKNFETIETTKVAEANEKLFVNREEGFIGTGLKKDEFICNCSDIDDIIVFFKNGKYKIVKVSEKIFVGKNILHIAVFKKNDKRTIYNAIYREGKTSVYYMKRFAVSGVSRDKEYDLTTGIDGSKVVYFSANPNGEAEVVKVTLKPTTRRIKNLVFEKDFSELAIKGRQSRGNLLTKFDVQKIVLKEKGNSTLGGINVWFDPDISRLNHDGRGVLLGEFFAGDSILVINKNGEYSTTNYDLNNHFNENLLIIEKFDAKKVWSLALIDADQQNYPYIKRFQLEPTAKPISILGENSQSKILLLSDTPYPRFEVEFGGNQSFRENLIVDVEEFIGIKSVKAKGKRITTFEIKTINEIEPIKVPEVEPSETEEQENSNTETADTNDIILGDESGQMTLF